MKQTDLESQLHEREKELDALYKLSILFTKPNLTSAIICDKTAVILKEAMQYPDNADVGIFISDFNDPIENNSVKNTKPVDSFSCSSIFSINKRVTIFSYYFQPARGYVAELVFLDRERYLVESTTALLANVLQKNELENILRESTIRLQKQTDDLEKKNIALHEIMAQYGIEKKNYQDEEKTFLNSIIYPEISKLLQNEKLSSHDRDLILNIRFSLENKFGKDSNSLTHIQHLLTPRELEVCNLIKNGMLTKEISSLLGISELTVERHRNTVRKKLKLNNSNINLTSFLRNPVSDM
ncbi:MAG: helix-turn-helix transcriptional regulator [Spirochaetales bacterium]|uniref:Helix-turn-helix transcriptional regulator n=1 Tax=Candidatus Thalassospirochaeta sargassi TaxID=3119039 RepID=A0AAJ1MPI7_9SPIO|nr:helix-turn-helix transcriptional regulator [Spirochaetales bacterium]